MNKALLNKEVQDYISQHIRSDVSSLLLKGIPFDTISAKDLVEQIEAKSRCIKKLPTWFNTENIYYPNKLNIEQTSSETTAKYKANLISGDSIVDLTGGFGVDCLYFSKQFKTVVHCEVNEELSKIVNHNYKQLDVKNIETVNGDGIDYLRSNAEQFDWIYIDPSRRHDSKGKVFFLKDCLPNVPEHLDLLFKSSKNILIKTSPLLDISVGLNELKHVKTIHVVALNNEVKELLWELEAEYLNTPSVQTVNLKSISEEHFGFSSINSDFVSEYSMPLTYLYEPNAAILKSGGFHQVSQQLSVYKLHQHSHLYTSADLIEFPGRSFKIEKLVPYNKKELKKLGIKKANVTTRNFPETVQQIRKKLGLKDGGDAYIFFTTDTSNKKVAILCSKI
ncbi:class I SAM-dependent methyltransferase [Seonamhaeicola marinus]|uniref:Class I SAM-dependent methyltransferase n=1 Tax=Seonamhaeicola marinus TaxID=1912246 RepID=A0A5D0I6Z1_9FLAO|nr:RsmD family RNA methyltransferase [Seonamhaeicola marinus]TYA78630.1 class I SAM-dependent methyltransferase [Seonamhaeicola marinus]